MITEPVPVPLKTRRSPQITPIRASSAAEVWVVGDVSSGTVTKTLFVHCTSCDREA